MTFSIHALQTGKYLLSGASSTGHGNIERTNLTELQVFQLARSWHLDQPSLFEAFAKFDELGHDVAYFGILGTLDCTNKAYRRA